ncbi:MAG: alpha/beta fold hydrolase [Candidatus Eremiobacteraeota bacterium]|nr:alpha/beta fold hydrolase [Candidatus Eremiobacteraeota bacterium]
MSTSQRLPDFVLVHGAFSDSSVWANITAPLIAAGAQVTAIDLPSHTAADNSDAGKTTLADYVASVKAAVAAASGPVILAGHSLGGMTITQVAEALPEKVAALVYVCAFLPENGRSAISYAQTDTESKFGANFQADAERGVGTLSREALIETVFNQTAESERRAATATILDEALQPFATPAETTLERFGSVARYYIATTNDRALTPALQQAMLAALPCAKVYSVDADHMPMMSASRGVVDALLDVRSLALVAV